MKLVMGIVLALATCGEPPRPETPEDVVRAREEAVRIVRVSDGQDVSEETMLAELAAARVIYIGERHGRATDHAFEHRMLRELLSRDPSLGVGMEMIQSPYQSVLNTWSDGDIDETNLRRDVEWDSRWGHDFSVYRPIFEFIRARHVRAYALNAPSEITRAVARDGLDSLDEERRAALPMLNVGNDLHRGLVMGALGDHAETMSAERLENMYTAQVIWDETMARGVAEALEGENAPGRLLVFAGRMHIQAGLGIPSRAANRGAQPFLTVLTADEESDDLRELLAAQPPAADFIWVVDPDREID